MLLCLTPLKYKHKITGTIDEESSKTEAKPIFEESRVYNEKEFKLIRTLYSIIKSCINTSKWHLKFVNHLLLNDYYIRLFFIATFIV